MRKRRKRLETGPERVFKMALEGGPETVKPEGPGMVLLGAWWEPRLEYCRSC